MLSFLLLTISSFSQQLSEKQKERENNKVKIHNSEENDNLQGFYHEEVSKMKLSESKEETYYEVLLSHTFDMSRLDDKDKDYTKEEIRNKFNGLVNKMNAKMKELLTPEQYIIHLETFSKIVYSVNRKNNWSKN